MTWSASFVAGSNNARIYRKGDEMNIREATQNILIAFNATHTLGHIFGKKEGFFNFKEIKALFMAQMASLPEKERNTLIAWLAGNHEIAGSFRKYIATHPNPEDGRNILISYAGEQGDEARTNRFRAETRQAFTLPKIKISPKEIDQKAANTINAGLKPLKEWVEDQNRKPRWQRIFIFWK